MEARLSRALRVWSDHLLARQFVGRPLFVSWAQLRRARRIALDLSNPVRSGCKMMICERGQLGDGFRDDREGRRSERLARAQA